MPIYLFYTYFITIAIIINTKAIYEIIRPILGFLRLKNKDITYKTIEIIAIITVADNPIFFFDKINVFFINIKVKSLF